MDKLMSGPTASLFETPQLFDANKIRKSLAESLSCEIESYVYEELPPINVDKWTAVSGLHKAVRRGEIVLANMYATTLINLDPNYLFRRLPILVYEDLGIADSCMYEYINALNSKVIRNMYGDKKLASYLVGKIAKSPKNRTATDILCQLNIDPDADSYLHGCLNTPVNRLVHIATDTNLSLNHRMTALKVISGFSERQSNGYYRTISKPRLDLLQQVCEDMSASPSLTNAVLLGNGKTEGLNAALLLANEMLMESSTAIIAEDKVPSQYYESINLAALDIYCRSGRTVISQLVATSKSLQKYFTAHPVKNCARLVGTILYIIEGSLLYRELHFDGSHELKANLELAEIFAAGMKTKDEVDELTALVRFEIPLLNDLRISYLKSIDDMSHHDLCA